MDFIRALVFSDAISKFENSPCVALTVFSDAGQGQVFVCEAGVFSEGNVAVRLD